MWHGDFPHRDEVDRVELAAPPCEVKHPNSVSPEVKHPTPVPSAASRRDPLPAFSIRAVFLQCGRLFSQSYTIIGLCIGGLGAVKPK